MEGQLGLPANKLKQIVFKVIQKCSDLLKGSREEIWGLVSSNWRIRVERWKFEKMPLNATEKIIITVSAKAPFTVALIMDELRGAIEECARKLDRR